MSTLKDKLLQYADGCEHKLDDLITIFCDEATTTNPAAKFSHDLAKTLREKQLCPCDVDPLTSLNKLDSLVTGINKKRNYLLVEAQHMLSCDIKSFDLLFRKSIENWQKNSCDTLKYYKDRGLGLFNKAYIKPVVVEDDTYTVTCEDGNDLTLILDKAADRWVQLGADIDGEEPAGFAGFSVSISNDGLTVAIGAVLNDGINGGDSGHTRVYQYNGTTWVQLGSDIDGEDMGDQSGHSVSLNGAGDIVAIGAIRNDGTGSFQGHTRIYQYDGSDWVQLGDDIDGEDDFDQSGFSVSLNSAGDIVAIGSQLNRGTGAVQGHTRVYQYDGSNWVQLGEDIDGEADGDRSGYSVSLNGAGNIVAIGAIGNNGNGLASGHTRVYQYNGSSWLQLGDDIDGEAMDDGSGFSVSLNTAGDIVAIGAFGNDGNGSSSGHTRIYRYNGTAWIQLGSDIDGEAMNDNSGFSVSLSGDGLTVAIGAQLNDGTGTDQGHTRIYQYNGTTWVQIGADIDGEADINQSGWSVSLSACGSHVAIGALFNNLGVGHTRIFNLNPRKLILPDPASCPREKIYIQATDSIVTSSKMDVKESSLAEPTDQILGVKDKAVVLCKGTDCWIKTILDSIPPCGC